MLGGNGLSASDVTTPPGWVARQPIRAEAHIGLSPGGRAMHSIGSGRGRQLRVDRAPLRRSAEPLLDILARDALRSRQGALVGMVCVTILRHSPGWPFVPRGCLHGGPVAAIAAEPLGRPSSSRQTAQMSVPVIRLLAALAVWILALAVLAVGVTREAAVAGSLDDVFVVLHEARGWGAHLGVLPQSLGAEGLGRPLVEGATSPADVLVKMISLVVAPSADPLVVAGWVCLAWLSLGAFVISRGAVALGAGWSRAAIVTMGWASSLGLVEAASYRLEGALFAATWTALLIASALERRRTALVLALLLGAVRPEGLVLGPAAALWCHRSSLGRLVVARCIATAVPTLAFRLLAFGTWAPQSYFAKSSDSRLLEIQDGLSYLDAALRTPAGLATLLLGSGALWALWVGRPSDGQERSQRRVRSGLIGLSALAAVILVLSGGDGYAGSRLAVPLAGPIWISASLPAPGAVVAQRTCLAFALGLQLIGLHGAADGGRWKGAGAFEVARTTVERMRSGPSGLEAFEGDQEILRVVAEALDGETLAHRHAQRFRWFSPDLAILDLTGLTSAAVSRLPAPHRVTFGRDAIAFALDEQVGAFHLDVLRARSAPIAAESPLVLADGERALKFVGPPALEVELAARLAEGYVGASRRHPGAAGWFNILVRRDLAARFASEGFRVGH